MILKKLKIIVLIITSMISSISYANNLSVRNVAINSRDLNSKSIEVKFDISWNNSWKNKINHDAVWLTVRLNNSSDSTINKKLCEITSSGLNPTGTSVGTNTSLEIYVPSDKKGAFISRNSNGNVSDINSQNVQLTVNYNSCGFADNDSVNVSIFGLEMVYIPEGDFYAGDYSTSTASLSESSTPDSAPWHIISENVIPVSNAGAYFYKSNNNASEFASGTSFNIPASFPKGYSSFYVMKYEITEGQWIEFVNSLGSQEARVNRDITNGSHKSSDSVDFRNTISCSGSPTICTSLRPSRPVSYLNWMDLAAFLDWAAIRPMTELEFEKICRGPLTPIKGEYSWGSTDIFPANNISGTEDGTESILDVSANANFGNSIFSGGDSVDGPQYQKGPLRVGVFAKSSSNRITAGSGYYGVLELSGNLKERVVTIGNSNGLNFDAQNGDGVLSSTSGFEGNANTANWPGIDSNVTNGVTGSAGSGFRGGSWADSSELLRISDRSEAALTLTTATSSFGGRGVRSYDGN